MAFGKKATADNTQGGNSSYDPVAWSEWNSYLFDCFSAKAKAMQNGKLRKEKVLIGKVNLIVDLGTPPAADSQWQTKCALPEEGEEYSQEELAWKEKNPTHDFVWTMEYNDNTKKAERTRKQTSPSYPSQEYGVAVDFPQIMVDYSKHPNAAEGEPESLRPYRISLNGSFHSDYYKTIVFDGSYKPVSDKNLLYKIATAAGKENELINSGFDIGVIAESVCGFTVRLDKQTKDDSVKVFANASKPASVDDFENPATGDIVSAEDQIKAVMSKEGICDFVGLLIDKCEDYDYTPEMLDMVKGDTYGYVKRASMSSTYEISGVSKKTGEPYCFEKGISWEGSDLQKALAAHTGSKQEAQGGDSGTEKGSESKEGNKPSEDAPSAPKEVIEPAIDFDDDIPF